MCPIIHTNLVYRAHCVDKDGSGSGVLHKITISAYRYQGQWFQANMVPSLPSLCGPLIPTIKFRRTWISMTNRKMRSGAA